MADVVDNYVGSGECAATFRTFLAAISDLALVATLDGRILFANEVLLRKLGYDERDLTRMRILDLLPANDREANEGMVAAILRGKPSNRGLPLAVNDGTVLQVMPRVWLGRWNGATCLFCVFRDLSAEVAARHQFECLFRSSPSLMALTSLPDRRLIDINDAALERLGYSREEVIGKTSLELGLFSDLEQRLALADKIQSAQPIVDFEVQIRCKDGTLHDGLLSADVISNQGQRQLLTRIVDITARKNAEAALRVTNLELRAISDEAEKTATVAVAASRAKSEFLAKMSHEIRTPMNAVVGFTDLLLTTHLTEEQQQYLDIIKGRGLDLVRIIDDILDLARIEAEQVCLTDEPFDVAEAVASTVASVKLRAEQKGLVLRSAIAKDVPARLGGDSLRLRQVLLNLLSNAVKFTAEGTVDLRVERVQTPGDTPCGLRFVVADTGRGIPLARQQAVFEPFIQAETTTAKSFGGTGLGLTICRRLVEKMGGEIGVESQPGRGSTFAFTAFFRRLVPAVAAPEKPRTTAASKPSRPLHILLVEDDPPSRMLATMLLRREGHTVEEACEGESALHAARRRDFDLVLMDVHMPVMDGLSATRAIRALATDPNPLVRKRSQVPIVAVTALAMRGDAERCLEAGMNRYLTKPLEPSRLRACLDEFSPSV